MLITLISVGGIVTALIAAGLFILGILIVRGKGDGLIAGYNTATCEQKSKVIATRLRWVVAVLLWLAAVYCALIPKMSPLACIAMTMALTVVTVIGVVLANTWCIRHCPV